jgi:UDPglucose--hexose-1-phosphate uridylyltransferase
VNAANSVRIFLALIMDKTEMRLDPLTQAWTIFSPARPIPPTFGSVLSEPAQESPFVAGAERFTGAALHAAPEPEWQVRVVPNRAPVLRVEGEAARRADGFYDRMDGVGAHEIIIEDPGENSFEELPLAQIERIIAAWKLRMLDLMKDPRMRSFTVVKNVGAPAGERVRHSVSQLLAMATISPLLLRKLQTARAFFAARKRSIFEDILHEEVRTGARLVYENNGFTVFCPYAARAPFELAVYPKRQCPDFHGLSGQETSQLADVLKVALRKLNRALNHAPYNLMLFTAPTRTPRGDHWTTIERDFRWHIEILPRLFFRNGVELATGCWLNSVWPEVAASHLRSIELSE